MVSSDTKIVEGLRSTSLVSIGAMDDVLSSVKSYFNLRAENQQLRLQNTRLALENFHLQDAVLENIRLRRLLQLKHQLDYDLLPAKVVGFSPQDFVTGYLLSSSKLNPAYKNSAVITAEGLVGKIVKISAGYAICQNLLDPNSRVSVRIQRNRELGIVRWNGGDGLLLENVPNTIDIRPGDVLFTSGMSRIYPPNIKVGFVTKVQKNTQHLFQSIQVKPALNFNRIEEVFILVNGAANGF